MDQVGAVAEEERRTHQSFAKIKRLEHFIASWWLLTLGGGGRGEGREREREREKGWSRDDGKREMGGAMKWVN